MLALIAAVALDLGSTTIKAGLLSADGELVRTAARPAPEVGGDGGRYESDALAYAQTAEAVLEECLAGMDGRPPLGLCCQRSSFLIWERASGRPVTPLISWQDDRGAVACDELRGEEATIRALAGLPLTPYYLAPKLRVLLRENPSWRGHLASGEWLVGTLDSFLIWRWTDGVHHRIDASMAARTLLMDIRERQWSPRLCELFDMPREALPQICPSAGWSLPMNNGLTLRASLADQSAALAASIVPGESEALVNLGTGGFVIRYLPDGRVGPEGYLRTLAWQEGDGRPQFACEGTLNSIGAALAPYPVADCRIEMLAGDDIFCIAEPSGIGAPYFRKDFGLMFSAPTDELPRLRVAALLVEGVAFRVARILEDMQREFGIERLYLSGGLSNLPVLQQAIACCVPFATVHYLVQPDAGLVGAARLAAGMHADGGGCAGKIEIIQSAPKLLAKYERWKSWLDGLLRP